MFYGADAIAGRNGNLSITGGFGDIDKDRFNMMLSYRHDGQRQLAATDRRFGSTSYACR